MKARDDRAWAEQMSEFDADEQSQRFRDFLLFWVDTAEKIIEEEDSDQGFQELGWGDDEEIIHEVVSNALSVAEQTLGFLSVEWISQMLLVITQHWERGEQLLQGLTFIETRLVEQATAMKLAELQVAASISTEE